MFVTPITSCAALMAQTAQAPSRTPAEKMKKLLHAQNMIADAPSQRASAMARRHALQVRAAELQWPELEDACGNDKHAAPAIVHSIMEVGDRAQPEEAKHGGEPPEVVNGIDAERRRRGAAGIEVPADEFLEEMGCSRRRERQRQARCASSDSAAAGGDTHQQQRECGPRAEGLVAKDGREIPPPLGSGTVGPMLIIGAIIRPSCRLAAISTVIQARTKRPNSSIPKCRASNKFMASSHRSPWPGLTAPG